MDYTEIDLGYTELYPNYADEEIIEADYTYVEAWDEPYQEIADRIFKEYTQTTPEDSLTEYDINIMDNLVFDMIGYEQE